MIFFSLSPILLLFHPFSLLFTKRNINARAGLYLYRVSIHLHTIHLCTCPYPWSSITFYSFTTPKRAHFLFPFFPPPSPFNETALLLINSEAKFTTSGLEPRYCERYCRVSAGLSTV